MISRYQIFCEVVLTGSFTKVASKLGYSQSAISQSVKVLENELNTILVRRKKEGIQLTEDGKQFFPYIQSIARAEEALACKNKEIEGLENSTIHIGTFTSVSRNLLPSILKEFEEKYPHVNFVLQQGEYTNIEEWIKEGSIDFGFVNVDAVSGVQIRELYKDKMKAIFPKEHKLSNQPTVSLKQLQQEPFILLDEGNYSLPLVSFQREGLAIPVKYKIYDDYSILRMVKEGIGISMIYETVLEGFTEGLTVLPIEEKVERTVGIAYKEWKTMPYAAKKLVEYIEQSINIS